MIFFIILGLYLIIFFNYSDLFFYRYGIDAILIIILAVIILIYQILKNNIPFRKEFSLWTLFFVIELIINYFNSYYFYDSLVYVILLVSLCIICNYIFNLDSKNNHKILISIVIIGLINLIFSIIELTCKFFGYKDIFLLNNSLYIGTKNYIGGLLYLPSFNALLLNTTAFLMLFYINKINNKLTLVGSKIIILLMLFMSIYTGSRSSFIAMIFATILFIFFSHKYKINNEVKKNFYIFFTTYFIIIVLTIFIPNLFLNYGTNPINKFYNAGTDPSIYSRLNIWHAQLLMFLDKPLFGWGMDSFKYLFNVYQQKSLEIFPVLYTDNAMFVWGHNEFLQLLSEGGLFFIVFLIFMSYKYIRNILNNIDELKLVMFLIVIIFVVQSMFSWELRNPFLMLMFVIFLGISSQNNIQSTIYSNKINIINKCLLTLLLLVVVTFFYLITPAVIKEVYYINKIKKTDNFYEDLYYLDLCSSNKFLYFWANHLYIVKATEFLYKDIFDDHTIPLTKESFKTFNFKKLLNYDKIPMITRLEIKTKDMLKLRQLWFYYYSLGLTNIIKKEYKYAYKDLIRAEKLNKNDDAIFALMHFANVLKAAKETGRPVEDFLPSEKDVKNLQDSMKKQLQLNSN